MKLKLGGDVAALNPDVTDARLPGPGASKYRNHKIVRDGLEFDSRAEADRYAELCLMQRAGEISGLETQPQYTLTVRGVKICDYYGDFRYWQNGQLVVEDVKGVRTPEYRLKAKLMLACHGIAIVETKVGE